MPDGEIRLSQRAIPAMLTLDPNAVRLDCLGYLMHRIGRDGRRIAVTSVGSVRAGDHDRETISVSALDQPPPDSTSRPP